LENDLALATFILAGATVALAGFVLWQVILQTKQLAASQRPCVYPMTPHKWLAHHGDGGRWLAFRNGGTGIAQNVRGELWWHDKDGHAVLVGQTLGAGDHFRVWLLDRKRVTRWYGAEGYVIYEDVRGVSGSPAFDMNMTAAKSGRGSTSGIAARSSANRRTLSRARDGPMRSFPGARNPARRSMKRAA
jgi:hypothetical protein